MAQQVNVLTAKCDLSGFLNPTLDHNLPSCSLLYKPRKLSFQPGMAHVNPPSGR